MTERMSLARLSELRSSGGRRREVAMSTTAERGDVFQIVNMPEGRRGWIGAFVLVTEPKSFGFQGFVHCLREHDSYSAAYIRLRWDQVERVGRAVLIPGGDDD